MVVHSSLKLTMRYSVYKVLAVMSADGGKVRCCRRVHHFGDFVLPRQHARGPPFASLTRRGSAHRP